MKFLLLLLILLQSVLASNLSGRADISTHDYEGSSQYLDSNPVYCGFPGRYLDLARITAVQGIAQSDCGTCLKVTSRINRSRSVFVMAVDMGGQGLDLSTSSFRALFNEDSGRFSAEWQPVPSSHCQGIINEQYYASKDN